MNNNSVHLTISPHPFAVERLSAPVAAGSSIAQMMADAGVDNCLTPYAHVYIDGAYIPQDRWTAVRPKNGATVTIRMVPMGGGGKNPLRTVLSLAVMAASPMITAGLTTALGGGVASFMGIGAGRLITAGVNLLGRLAVNALAPPGRSRFANDKESPTLFIQGARNSARPFARVPMVLGKHRMVPPLGASPYTETAGNDQYLRMLFVWGYGPVQLSDLKIGETPLEDFDDVEIETRLGYPDDAPITLYSNSVLQNDLNIKLTAADGYVTRTTETDADEITVDITCPGGLFKFGKKGNKAETSVQVEVQYSPTGEDDWSPGGTSYKPVTARNLSGLTVPIAYTSGGITRMTTRIDRIVMDPASGNIKTVIGRIYTTGNDGDAAMPPALPAGYLSLALVERRGSDSAVIPAIRIQDDRKASVISDYFENDGDFLVTAGIANTVTVAAGGLKYPGILIKAMQSSALRRAVTFRVPKGQYDVRLRRLTADSDDDNVFDETHWTALKTIRHAKPVAMTGVAMTAIRIKATDQLNGVIDRFNGVVQGLVKDYTGTDWQIQPTSNPASLFRHVLQGIGNARPLSDDRLSLPRLQEWHDHCRDAGHEFNAVIDTDLSVREVLQDIAAAGRASPALLDGKWAVIEDLPQTVPVQHFTPANTFNFKGEKSFDETPHALRVRYINRDKGWTQDERLVFDDGFSQGNATRYDSLDLTGITSAAQAWKAGRYHIATARLRPESFSFFCDLEHIVCTRGDLIRFSHDVPMIGLGSGRVTALQKSGGMVTGVTLDNEIAMEDGKNYALRLRLHDGSSLVKNVVTQAGSDRNLTFKTAETDSSLLTTGVLALFGIAGRESLALIVRSIEPQSNLTAKITAVDAAPGVHLADTGVIPAYQSGMTVPPDMMRPPTPVLTHIQSGPEAAVRNGSGIYDPRILITLQPPASLVAYTPRVSIRQSGDDRFQPASAEIAHVTAICLRDVAAGASYDIQIQYVSENDMVSLPMIVNGHRVEGLDKTPANVADFSLSCLGDTAHLSWSRVSDIDLDHYVLRFTPLTTGAAWENAPGLVTSVPGDVTSISVPSMTGTYMIKAVDQGGRFSDAAALAVSTAASLTSFNAIFSHEEPDSFSGLHDGTMVTPFGLQLAGADSVDDWADLDIVLNTDIGGNGMMAEGNYIFENPIDLGACYLSRVTADLRLTALDTSSVVEGFRNIDQAECFDQTADPSNWQGHLWMSVTEDNPADPGAQWSAWSSFVVGDVCARGYRFKMRLGSEDSNVTPLVQSMKIMIDMPDRVVSQSQLGADATGIDVLFPNGFRDIPAVAITAHNLNTGDYWTITSVTETGFHLRFYDASGTGVSRLFDYVAKGVGSAF